VRHYFGQFEEAEAAQAAEAEARKLPRENKRLRQNRRRAKRLWLVQCWRKGRWMPLKPEAGNPTPENSTEEAEAENSAEVIEEAESVTDAKRKNPRSRSR
jgi:hypothetical protein